MDTILQQKRKGEQNFRFKIDQIFADSIFTKEQDQLSLNVLQEIFATSSIEGMFSNSKINIQKLIESSISGQNFSYKKDLTKIFKDKKQMKVSQLHNLLKLHELTEFDLEQQIKKNLFEGDKFSFKKLDQTMSELGMNKLNKKDKQILLQCFDYNRDNLITKKDLQQLMDKAVEKRSNLKKNSIRRNTSRLSKVHE